MNENRMKDPMKLIIFIPIFRIQIFFSIIDKRKLYESHVFNLGCINSYLVEIHLQKIK